MDAADHSASGSIDHDPTSGRRRVLTISPCGKCRADVPRGQPHLIAEDEQEYDVAVERTARRKATKAVVHFDASKLRGTPTPFPISEGTSILVLKSASSRYARDSARSTPSTSTTCKPPPKRKWLLPLIAVALPAGTRPIFRCRSKAFGKANVPPDYPSVSSDQLTYSINTGRRTG
jgi:hypothetical protein